MKKNNWLIVSVLIPGIIGSLLGIAVGECIKHTTWYEEHYVEATTRIVENSVEDVNNYTTTEEPLPTIDKPYPYYTPEQLEILAIIIYQEAGGDMYTNEVRRMVGSVFLNRVNSTLYPDTFEEVATQRKQYGTLYLTGIKWPDRASKPEEAVAVERAYMVAEQLLIFGSILPENVIYQAEFKQGSGVYDYREDIYFCFK